MNAIFDKTPAVEAQRPPYRLPWSYLGELVRDGITPHPGHFRRRHPRHAALSVRAGAIYELGAASDYYRRMAPKGQRYVLTNIDASAEQRVDMTDMALPDNSVDAFFTAFALEHIHEYRKAISEMRRTLKPGGRMLIVVPFLYYFHGAPDDYVRFTTSYMRSLLSGMKLHRLFGLGTRALLVAEMFHEKPFTQQDSSPPLRFLYRMFAAFCTATYMARPRWDAVFPSAVVVLAEKPLE